MSKFDDVYCHCWNSPDGKFHLMLGTWTVKRSEMIKLGNQVKDIITGFTGIVIARTEWLYGCTRIGIVSQVLRDGKPIEAQWFDEQRIEVLAEEAPKISADSSAASGGPQRDPSRRAGG